MWGTINIITVIILIILNFIIITITIIVITTILLILNLNMITIRRRSVTCSINWWSPGMALQRRSESAFPPFLNNSSFLHTSCRPPFPTNFSFLHTSVNLLTDSPCLFLRRDTFHMIIKLRINAPSFPQLDRRWRKMVSRNYNRWNMHWLKHQYTETLY